MVQNLRSLVINYNKQYLAFYANFEVFLTMKETATFFF
jgi:hypothetical protein